MSSTRLPVGIRKFNTNESVGSADLTNVGNAAVQTIMDALFAVMLGARTVQNNPLDGVQSGFFGNSGAVTVVSGLQVAVNRGVGLYDRIGRAGVDPEDEPLAPMYVPMTLASSETVTLDAHDATHPRVDTVWCRPESLDLVELSRRVRAAGTAGVDDLHTKRGFGMEVGVTKGTPDINPSAPSIPSDALALADVRVPAVSGAVSITDRRTQLVWSSNIPAIPDQTLGDGFARYARAIVPRASNDELKAESAGSGLGVTITPGYIDVRGARRYYPGGTVTLATAHATLTRIDLIYYDASDLAVKVVTGTPAADPTRPTLPSTEDCPLAYYSLPGAATTISDVLFDRVRPTKPYTEEHVELDADVIRGFPVVSPKVSLGVSSGGTRTMTIQAVDQAGDNFAGAVYFLVHAWNDSVQDIYQNLKTSPHAIAITDGGAGTVIEGSGDQIVWCLTDTSGTLVLDFTQTSGGDMWVTIKPVRYLNGDTPGSAANMAAQTYQPGGEALAYVSVAAA